MEISQKIRRVIKFAPSQSIIVYDIDGTLIGHDGTPRSHIVDTYFHATRNGHEVAIITARPGTPENIERTRRELANIGISKYKCIYFLPPEKIYTSTPNIQARFKYLARKDLHNNGQFVFCSIGDMPWDIGDYGGIGFLV
jgi:hypothetical protein